MPFTDDLDPELVGDVTEAYKKAATYLPFSALEIKEVFSEKELAQVEKPMTEMAAATTENERQKKILAYPSIVLKLLTLARIV